MNIFILVAVAITLTNLPLLFVIWALFRALNKSYQETSNARAAELQLVETCRKIAEHSILAVASGDSTKFDNLLAFSKRNDKRESSLA